MASIREQNALADSIFRRYLSLRLARGAIPSPGLAETGYASTCCTAPLTRIKGVIVCSECRQKRGQREIRAIRAPARSTWNHIHVSATRTPDRSAEDRRAAARADRWVGVSITVETPPEGLSEATWVEVLSAWQAATDPRVRVRSWSQTCARVAEMAVLTSEAWGLTTGDLVARGIGIAREIVASRYHKSLSVRRSIGPVLVAENETSSNPDNDGYASTY